MAGVENLQDLPSYELSLRLVAMRNVLSKDPPQDYTHRYINRWYSVKFNTPLHVVDTLPRHEVLLAYYESIYFEMNEGGPEQEQALNTEIQNLINPVDLTKEEAARVEDYLFEKKIEEEAKKTKDNPVKPRPKMVVGPIDLDEEGPVSLNFADINKLDLLEGTDEPLVGLK